MKTHLITKGLEGIPQSDFLTKFRTYHSTLHTDGFTGEEIREILTDWHIRGLVQRFKKRRGLAKKPTMFWRATTLIMTEPL